MKLLHTYRIKFLNQQGYTRQLDLRALSHVTALDNFEYVARMWGLTLIGDVELVS
jgi:ABC-type transport system involved in cytochrome c biogenesis permease subunit